MVSKLPSKSEIEGLAEKKIDYANLISASGYALRFEKKLWTQKISNLLPYAHCFFFFSKINLLILRLNLSK